MRYGPQCRDGNLRPPESLRQCSALKPGVSDNPLAACLIPEPYHADRHESVLLKFIFAASSAVINAYGNCSHPPHPLSPWSNQVAWSPTEVSLGKGEYTCCKIPAPSTSRRLNCLLTQWEVAPVAGSHSRATGADNRSITSRLPDAHGAPTERRVASGGYRYARRRRRGS